MRSSIFREITLYRYRYIIGYGVFALLVVILLVFEIGNVPRGLSAAEMHSAVTSNQFSFLHPVAAQVIDSPYHLLQKASIKILGLTPLSIKLPSLMIGFMLAFMLALSLRQWFTHNVAVLAALIGATTTPFLTMGREGTPLIMASFWTVCILFGGIRLVYEAKPNFRWKLFCMVAAVLLVYSPLGLYPLLALAIAGLIHPHIRHQLRRTKPWQLVVLIFVGLLLFAPLVLSSVKQPSVLLTLLGVEDLPRSLGQIVDHLRILFGLLLNFNHTTVTSTITPLFNIVTLALMLLGFLRLCRDYFTARSYLLSAWMVIVAILLILQPLSLQLLFTPAILLLAIGVDTLIRQWYKLFPRNPYARIGALLPLSILLLAITTANVSRYIYVYTYTDYGGYSLGLRTVRKALNTGNQPTTLVANDAEASFYDILRARYPDLHVTSTVPTTPVKRLMVLDNSQQVVSQPPSFIYSSSLSSNGIILRIYD